jgi:tetratricopeptide (TPR) repeat protein
MLGGLEMSGLSRIFKFMLAALATTVSGCTYQSLSSLGGPAEQNSSLETFLYRGDQARSAGDLDSAETLYNKAAATNPRTIKVWLRLGAVQIQREEFLAAMGSYREAQSLDPINVEADYALGQLALRRGRPADAVQEIQAGLRGHSDDSKLNDLASTAYMRLGEPDLARDYHHIAVEQGFQHAPTNLTDVAIRPEQHVAPRAEPAQPPVTLRTEMEGLTPHADAPVQPTAGQGYRIQLGSERSEAKAYEIWERLQRRFPDLLRDGTLTVKRADLGAKGTFYRVQVGPVPDAPQAQERCTALIQGGVECLVVKTH